MTINVTHIEPFEVAALVDDYIDKEVAWVQKAVNREAFDETGAHSLHDLAARLYALGWQAGHDTGMHVGIRRMGRDRDVRVRNEVEAAWDEAASSAHTHGWLHDEAFQDMLGRNPYRVGIEE